jgi:hypothetical protein
MNGLVYSDEYISNGAYDFWGHEHLLTGPFASSTGLTVATNLLTKITALAVGGTSGYPYITSGVNQTMFADRAAGADQGFVTPL